MTRSARRCPNILLSLLLAAAAATSTRGQCEIYAETFEDFGGPADLDDGTFRVAWCTDGATITAGSFCPTGGALRLDAAGEDPIVWASFGGAGCTSLTLTVDYSQFAATGTVLRFAASGDAAVNCGAFVNEVGGVPDTVGGVCTTVSHTVFLTSGQSVYWKFDHGVNSNAFFLDNLRITATGCCGEGHGCCEEGGPGCDDPEVRDCVCAADPFCCDFAWDAQCVAEVESFGCGTCDGGGPSCVTAYAADFGDPFLKGNVCTLFPQWFETCEGTGPFLTGGTACGGAGDQAMTFAAGFPHSAAITPCLDVSGLPAATLRFAWTKPTGTIGPRVEVAVGDGAFAPLWEAPISFPGGCAIEQIDLAPYLGPEPLRFRFASGSSVSSGAAFDDIDLVPGLPMHDCCTAGAGGCDDAIIEACVCTIDPFCCETEWDDLCVIGVEFYACGDCGICVEAYAADFGDAFVPGTVCDLWPELFIDCAGPGPFVDGTGPCASPSDLAMRMPAGGAETSAVTRCISLAGLSAASLRFTYAAGAGSPPRVSISGDAGATFVTAWEAAPGPDAVCSDVCLDLTERAGAPFLLFRFTGGPGGAWFDDVALVPEAGCPAPADLDGDGTVGFADLLLLLGAWGPCPPPPCPGDVDGDGMVGFADLLALLGAWG